MRQREIPHIDPEVDARVGDLLLALPLDEVAHALVARVEGGDVVEGVDDGAEDERGTHGREGEGGFLGGEEVPGGFFGEGLGGAVAARWVLEGFLEGGGVPVGF